MSEPTEPLSSTPTAAPPPPSFSEATAVTSGPTIPAAETPQTSPATFKTRFACVTLNMTDRIRFINFHKDEVAALRKVVAAAWPPKIQEERSYSGAYEIKVYGTPWGPSQEGDDGARRLIRRLLEALYDMGWILQAAVDICKKVLDKDSLVFRHQDPAPPPCDWLSISFDASDKMKIVDAPPPDLAAAIVAALKSNYHLKSHEVERGGNSRMKLKFHGRPWFPGGTETVELRMLLLTLLEVLERFGFSLYASIDQVYSSKGHEADVLVVIRQKGWVPGLPIFHK